jgi:nucleoside-diphosphate-sugar epimerase
MRILVTGVAGFIGFHLVKRLLKEGNIIVGIDNLNNYYDVRLKLGRVRQIEDSEWSSDFKFIKMDLADRERLQSLFEKEQFDIVVNFGGQAGVRYSIENPYTYIDSNIMGFMNILECCRHYPVKHLLYCSSSSVYGGNTKVPFSEDDRVDSPVSLYAATKKSNELMAYVYNHLFGIPTTGLRFFTVYGPWGRPDMAYYSFTEKLLKGEKIKIFNYGNCKRDFTYIDDIVEGIYRVMKRIPNQAMVYNIGNSHPESLLDFVNILQEELVRIGLLPTDYDFAAHQELVPMQPGDVEVTYADTSKLEGDVGFKPSTSLRDGLRSFVEWYAWYKGLVD